MTPSSFFVCGFPQLLADSAGHPVLHLNYARLTLSRPARTSCQCGMLSTRAMSPMGHSLHFGSVSMSGLLPTTTEWRTFENGRNVPIAEVVKTHEASPSSKAFASFKSGVLKPSVNHP
jgi:hypothetical protein